MTKENEKRLMSDLHFEKINLPDVHIVHGKEFPVAYNLLSSEINPSSEKVSQFLEEIGSTGWFNKQIQDHGTLVLRGLGSTDPATITKFIKIIGFSNGDIPFVQVGSTATRTKLSDVLTTANEGNPDLYIGQHNEFSRFVKYPTKLFFACQKINGQGGETPITHGAEMFDALYKKDSVGTERLGKEDILFNQIWPFITPNRTSWYDFFCFGRNIKPEDDLATRKAKAELLIKEYVSEDFYWDKENNLVVNEHSEPIKKYHRPDGEEFPVFFNSLPVYYEDYKGSFCDSYKKTSVITYDNGKQIPDEYLENVLQKSIDLAYSHAWQEGDIAIVDNYQVSHGRAPWKNGDRVILVSMWDTPNKPVYQPWKGENSIKT